MLNNFSVSIRQPSEPEGGKNRHNDDTEKYYANSTSQKKKHIVGEEEKIKRSEINFVW